MLKRNPPDPIQFCFSASQRTQTRLELHIWLVIFWKISWNKRAFVLAGWKNPAEDEGLFPYY